VPGLPRELPRDLPVVERDVVRLVVLDMDERILLFETLDADRPEFGRWWDLPGGGMEPGETYLDAAARELREEAGLEVLPGRIGPATWRRTAAFQYRGHRRLQHEVVAVVRLDLPGPAVDGALRTAEEVEDYVGFRWWPVQDVVRSGDRFYPGTLPRYLPRVLAGEEVDEPFELWS